MISENAFQDSGSSPPWTWPFELDGPTLTSQIGLNKNGHRQKNDWIGPSVKPRYPVYIISKGRWQLRKTSVVLERMQVPYFFVIEPQERQAYEKSLHGDGLPVAKHCTILELPTSNLGQGSIPARNFVWEHSIALGAKRHWVMDDNLHCFQRLHRGEKQCLWTGAGFKALEDFVDRHSNVALAAPQYIQFANAKTTKAPYRLNTRVYSCILIKNDLPYRWRGRYNEDTDLSIRCLKDGWVTVLSNAFLVDKTTTMRNTGGNTETLYGGDGKAATNGSDTEGRRLMAESLREQHPDIVKVVRKFGRWHHSVDYRPFRDNKLVETGARIVCDYGLQQEMPHDRGAF